GSEEAAELNVTVTVVEEPAARGPLAGETLIHGWGAEAVHVSAEDMPVLVNVKICEAGANGPPTGPDDVVVYVGVTVSKGGRSNASNTPVVVELGGEVAL